MFETLPHASGLDPHRRVDGRIVGVAASEDLGRDHEFLQQVSPSRQGLFDDEGQELLSPGGVHEPGRMQDALELRSDFFGGGRAGPRGGDRA